MPEDRRFPAKLLVVAPGDVCCLVGGGGVTGQSTHYRALCPRQRTNVLDDDPLLTAKRTGCAGHMDGPPAAP